MVMITNKDIDDYEDRLSEELKLRAIIILERLVQYQKSNSYLPTALPESFRKRILKKRESPA